MKKGDKVRLLFEYGNPETTIKQVYEDTDSYVLEGRGDNRYPGSCIILSREWNKMHFKQGVEVRVKSLEWYEKNKDPESEIIYGGESGYQFEPHMTKYCGKVFKISRVLLKDCYKLEGHGNLVFLGDWLDPYTDKPNLKELDRSLTEALSKETPESLEHWINSKEELLFLVGDEVMVTHGKLKGRIGTVTDIEKTEDGEYTVSVDIPEHGVYVQDMSYFKRSPKKPLLSELIRGCGERKFYNPLLGEITATPSEDGRIIHIHYGGITIDISPDGTDSDGNMVLFPSRTQRDWDGFRESMMEEEISEYVRGCIDDEALDDTNYSIASGCLRRGLELSLKYTRQEIIKFLNKKNDEIYDSVFNKEEHSKD